MAASDALPVPRKNTAYRLTLPLYDSDGDLVPGATGLDSEVSKDGGTFVDCTNEATEIATASGVYYIDLTAAEMNADTVVILIKTSTSGAKTGVAVLLPQEAGDIRVNATYIDGVAVSTSTAQLGVNVVSLVTDSITSSALAASAVTEIQAGLSTLDASGVRNAIGLGAANLDALIDALPTALENATALLTYSNGVETGISPQAAMRLMLAALAGKLSGAATATITIRNVGDTVNRITATVDSDGNRTAVSTNVS